MRGTIVKRTITKWTILCLFIMGMYITLRLPLLPVQNAGIDYDEGTYLLIARLINQGMHPYNSIFAVHPPLYYYTLAAWMRVFGDNYIVGRSLSLFLGFLSVIVAYLTGKELRGEKLGLSFALIMTLDPMTIKLNTLVLHESMIEFFTLLSLWVLIKYLKEKNVKFAYASLAIASLGSTAKFTIIPYLVAIYVFILFSQSNCLKEYLLRITNRILSADQGRIIAITYLLWAGIVVAVGILVPTTFVRIFTIIPGLHSINKLGQVYTAVLFLLFWLGITVYLLQISYVREIPSFLRELSKDMKSAVFLASIIIISKALVEIPLGVMASRDYIQQTYIDQSNRGFPFTGIFQFVHNVLTTLQSNNLDSSVYMLSTFLLVAVLLILRQLGEPTDIPKELWAFLLLNIIFYLVIIPIIPNIRMVYSMFILFYLMALYPLASQKKKQVGALILISIILLAVNVGIDINYPSGKLSISSTPHIREFRNDLGEYIQTKNLTGVYLSINPMDAYYLNLTVVPYMVDTFGLGYLKKQNIVKLTLKYHPDYIILDTWMFAIMDMSPALLNVYQPFFNYTIREGTLLFAESDNRGDVVELFKLGNKTSSLTVGSIDNTIQVYVNGNKIMTFIPSNGTTNLKITQVSEGIYSIRAMSSNKTYNGTLQLNEDTLKLNVPGMSWILKSMGVPINNGHPLFNGTTKRFKLYLPNTIIVVNGNSTIKNSNVKIHGKFNITMGYCSSS